MQQGTLHSCREEPATGMGSGKGNTLESRVPTTPARGDSSAFPTWIMPTLRALPQAQDDRTLLNSSP